ncbi:MAG: protease [Nitrospira sp. WS238]|nr:protease [Nitrospira sp. WS238]
MTPPRLPGRTLVVLAEDLYEDLELWYPVLRFREEGARVVIAGPDMKSYHGKHGYPAMVETSVHTDELRKCDGVIIPGGYAPDRLRRHPQVLALVRDLFLEGKVVASICHAAWVLISSGIIRERNVTCHYAVKDDVVNAGGRYLDAEVVRDGKLITSRQPSDLGSFCREIIAVLEVSKAVSTEAQEARAM